MPPRDGPCGSINVPDQCRLFDSVNPEDRLSEWLVSRHHASLDPSFSVDLTQAVQVCCPTKLSQIVLHACAHKKGILSRITESFCFFMCCRDHPQPSPVLLRALCRKLPHTSHGDDYPLSPELSPRYPNTAYRSRSFDGTKLFFGSCSPIHCPVFIVARP